MMGGRVVRAPGNQLVEQPWRLLAIVALLVAYAIIVAGKLIHIQIFQHDYYLALANEEHYSQRRLAPPRGAILTSDGAPLAVSVQYETLYADTKLMADQAKVARLLAPVLGESQSGLEAKLAVASDQPLLLKRYMPSELADRVRALHLLNVYFETEPRRLHPEGGLGSQLVGFVGRDYAGLAGLEMSWNDDMQGRSGSVQSEIDTAGDEIALGLRNYMAPVGGADVVTNVDRFVQRLIERELEAAMQDHSADSGTIIVMDPRSGAILGMASRPSYSLDDPGFLVPDKEPLYRSPAVSDIYEPGSVFKVVTMSAGIDSGAVDPNETYDDEGYVVDGEVVIRNWNGLGLGPGTTMTQVLQRSLNTGSCYVARKLGADRFYGYLRAFGFGTATGVDLPGEAAGLVRDANAGGWSRSDLLTNSFGQGIAVTPLQMARAVAVVANEGRLMQPQVAREVRSPEGTRRIAPQTVRQVISPATARIVTDMLVNAVDNSVVGLAKLQGYRVAGKSGTAEILVNGRYSQEDTVASFVGFAPADAPRFLVLVAITRPKDNIWGEAVAAPIFSTIMHDLLNHAGIPPLVVATQ